MTDIDKQIIDMINKNFTLKQMSTATNLTKKQLYVRLKSIINSGYQIKPNYYYDGDIHYEIKKGFSSINNDYKIIVPKDVSTFKFMAISDLHLTNKKENLEYINRVYEYAVKNNINTIFNIGDLIEGTHTSDSNKDLDINDQIEYVIKKYPYDKSIVNYILYGNHDYHSLHFDGVDVARAIENARYDMVSFGYGDCNFKLKDEQISLNHNLSLIENNTRDQNSIMTLVGHGHEMKTKLFDKLILCVPCLSDVSPDKTRKIVPGALELELQFKNSKASYVFIKHLLVNPSIIECSQVRQKLNTKNNDKVKYYKK